jgi:hypothetical protein
MKNGDSNDKPRRTRKRRDPPQPLFRDEVFEQVLDHMPDSFDSHDFIFEMMRRFPREYTLSLYEYRRSKDPIQTLHQMIGRKLVGFSDRIRTDQKKSSQNVRGLPSENLHWAKVTDKTREGNCG